MPRIYQDVLDLATNFYGSSMTQDALSRLRSFCTCAVDILSTRLRQGLTYEDCRNNFVPAAALYAMSLLRAVEEGEVGLTSFDAGTLSLTFDSRHDQLTQTAKNLIAPWCDCGMAFVGVSV